MYKQRILGVLLAIVCLNINTIIAQEIAIEEATKQTTEYLNQNKYRIGIQSSFSLLSITGDEVTNSDWVPNMGFGVVGERFLLNKTVALGMGLGVRTENSICYSCEAITVHSPFQDPVHGIGGDTQTDCQTIEKRFTSTYLNIPLSVKFRTELFDNNKKVFLLAGVNNTLQLGSGKYLERELSAGTGAMHNGLPSEYAKLRTNFKTSAGLETNYFGSRTLSMGLFYERGLNKLDNHDTKLNMAGVEVGFYF